MCLSREVQKDCIQCLAELLYILNGQFLVDPLFPLTSDKWGVSDCCLTSTQQFFLAISWREQVNFQ